MKKRNDKEKEKRKKKKKNVHDLKFKKSLWFKGKGRIHMSISLEMSSALDKF